MRKKPTSMKKTSAKPKSKSKASGGTKSAKRSQKRKTGSATVEKASVKRASRSKKSGGTGAGNRPEQGTTVSEEAIQLRAYLIWEAAGKPDGDGVQFWLMAEQELTQGK